MSCLAAKIGHKKILPVAGSHHAAHTEHVALYHLAQGALVVGRFGEKTGAAYSSAGASTGRF